MQLGCCILNGLFAYLLYLFGLGLVLWVLVSVALDLLLILLREREKLSEERLDVRAVHLSHLWITWELSLFGVLLPHWEEVVLLKVNLLLARKLDVPFLEQALIGPLEVVPGDSTVIGLLLKELFDLVGVGGLAMIQRN